MLEYIRERLPEADDYTLEQIYDFLQEVEYWKEVIQYLIHTEGGNVRFIVLHGT